MENHEQALMKGCEGTVSSVMSLVEPTSIYHRALAKDTVLKGYSSKENAQSWKRFEDIHEKLSDDIVKRISILFRRFR
ncbi:type VI secretion system-associated FHA domain protein [Vibrio diabolicus]|uniref:type VI secretion system-associated FHA domain protein n=1 Tax=Vibrio diabolicus TaxID=50719 RepID=UPI00384C3E55